MKTYLFSLLLVGSLCIGCKNTSKRIPVVNEKPVTNSNQTATAPQAVQVTFEKMNGYFLKNNIKLENEVSGFVFADKETFIQTCGVGRYV